MKKQTPLEAHEAAIIEGAVLWTTFWRKGAFTTGRAEHESREAARDHAIGEASRTGRTVMIYAVDAAGRSTLVESVQHA